MRSGAEGGRGGAGPWAATPGVSWDAETGAAVGSRPLLGPLAWRLGTLGQWCWEEAVKVAKGEASFALEFRGRGECVRLRLAEGTVLTVES